MQKSKQHHDSHNFRCPFFQELQAIHLLKRKRGVQHPRHQLDEINIAGDKSRPVLSIWLGFLTSQDFIRFSYSLVMIYKGKGSCIKLRLNRYSTRKPRSADALLTWLLACSFHSAWEGDHESPASLHLSRWPDFHELAHQRTSSLRWSHSSWIWANWASGLEGTAQCRVADVLHREAGQWKPGSSPLYKRWGSVFSLTMAALLCMPDYIHLLHISVLSYSFCSLRCPFCWRGWGTDLPSASPACPGGSTQQYQPAQYIRRIFKDEKRIGITDFFKSVRFLD